jgi:hypothetical protein
VRDWSAQARARGRSCGNGCGAGGRGTRAVQARRDADQGTRAARAGVDETEVWQLGADPHGRQRGRARR